MNLSSISKGEDHEYIRSIVLYETEKREYPFKNTDMDLFICDCIGAGIYRLGGSCLQGTERELPAEI